MITTAVYFPRYRVEIVRDGSARIEKKETITSIQDIVSIAKTLTEKDREYLMCIWLNFRREIIGHEIISIGTLTASLAHPREIFKGALISGAAYIALAHNHPSGNPAPSEEDCRLTKRIVQCGLLLGVEVLDHVIVATDGCYSFKKEGTL